MKWDPRAVVESMLALILAVLLGACGLSPQAAGSSGTGWGQRAFTSNGERIYFTSTSERGTTITYTGGPRSSGWMMGSGRLARASCHGPDGRGGEHSRGMLQTMTAKDIRWSVLAGEHDAERFRLAVTEGLDPDGTQLSTDMPRWRIGNEDLADLIAYLKALP